ncbi:MAG: hypothetical protein QM529_05485 [Hydrotalea sp.]|nr:hypothetical protein [Hydrotalea sp.]
MARENFSSGAPSSGSASGSAKPSAVASLGLHPSTMQKIIGHDAALKTLTDGLLGSRIKHHAWLLTGPKGVGKATLAYHVIIKLLSRATPDSGIVMVPKDNIVVDKKTASNDDAMPDLFGGDLPAALPNVLPMDNLVDAPADEKKPIATANIISAVDIAKQLRDGSHPHFLLLDKTMASATADTDGDDKPAARDGKKTQITVGMVRGISGFLSFHGFDKNLPRIVMIDGAEDMNPAAANALLKNLEEPPQNTIFFLISHRPGILPATIRSRCFLLPLNPLPPEKLLSALGSLLPTANPAEQAAMAGLAAGRLGRAVEIYNEAGLNIYRDWLDFFINPDNEKPARRKKFLTNLLAQENPPRAQLFLSMVEAFFLRLARHAEKTFLPADGSAQALFADEEKTFDLFLASRELKDWLDFWQMQKTAFGRGFPPKNLNRDYLVLQLLDETNDALHHRWLPA